MPLLPNAMSSYMSRRQEEIACKTATAEHDLLEAAFDGDDVRLNQILCDKDIQVQVDVKDEHGFTSLSEAACAGQAECVELLLERGANPNTQGRHKRTPIWRAVYMNQISCIRPLLDSGADPRTHASDGDSAILLATSQRRTEISAIFDSWDSGPARPDPLPATPDPWPQFPGSNRSISRLNRSISRLNRSRLPPRETLGESRAAVCSS